MTTQANTISESRLILTIEAVIVNCLLDFNVDPVAAGNIAEVQSWEILRSVRKELNDETEST